MKFRKQNRLKPDSSDDEMRAYRRRMMVEDPKGSDKRLSLRWDFFDLYRCKDLLFHPLEHRYTVPQIGEFLDALGLWFRGLDRTDYDRNSFVRIIRTVERRVIWRPGMHLSCGILTPLAGCMRYGHVNRSDIASLVKVTPGQASPE